MTPREKDEIGIWQYAQKGCPGAIKGGNDFGKPSKKFCSDDDSYPWWQTCCEWKWSEGSQKCVPKSSSRCLLDTSQ